VFFLFSLQILYENLSVLEEFCKILSQMSIGLRVKYSLFWSDVNETGIFLDIFFEIFLKNTHISNFMKIRPARDEFSSVRTVGETYITKLIDSRFQAFAML
jgi:hypothetical protein